MAANLAANIAEKQMGNVPEGTAATGDISNPNQSKNYAHPTETMRALCWKGKNSVAVETVPKPAIVNPEDVIVKVTGTTICGSDLHLYHGSVMEMRDGDILGHEFMGIVDEVGPNVNKIKVGDRVVASFQIACGSCRFCAKKLSSQCERTNSSTVANMLYGHRTAGVLGYSHFAGGYAGGQAEYCRLPFGDVNLLKVPDSITDEQALFLSDVLPTTYNCVVDTGVYEGDKVGIWGAGPIGLFAAVWAFEKGAKRVVIIDNVPWRLEYCKSKLPNLETIDYGKVKSVTEEIQNMFPGGLDVSLECAAGEYAKSFMQKVELATGMQTDASDILNEMVYVTRPYGRVGITGLYTGFTNHFPIGKIMQTGVRFIGNGQAPVHLYWETILNDYIIPGKIDPNLMITHRIDISEMAELYKKFDERKPDDGIMKVFVQTKFSAPPGKGSPSLSSLTA